MARITAELRLSLDALRQDISRARNVIQRELGKQFQGGAGGGAQGVSLDPSGSIADIMAGTPPVIPGLPKRQSTSGRSATAPSFGTAGFGLLAGMFSPWVGGAALARSGIFNTAIGKQISGLFGGGMPGNFLASYTGLVLSTRLLKAAFEELKSAVERTAKLYQESAAINRPVGRIFQIQAAFKAIGLSDDAAKRYAKSGPAGLNTEEMMRLTNMSDSFKRNFADAAMDAQIISDAAKDAQRSFEKISTFQREWHTFWTSDYNLIIDETLGKATTFLKLANLAANTINGLFVGHTPTDVGGLAGGKGMFNWNNFRTTSMERMGFTIGGNGVMKETNSILRNILKAVSGGNVNAMAFGAAAATNLP